MFRNGSDVPLVWALEKLDISSMVEVWWTVEKEWYAGRVASHEPVKKQHGIK